MPSDNGTPYSAEWQARIDALEKQIEAHTARQRILEATNRVRGSVAAMVNEDDWRRVVVDSNRELSSLVEYNSFSINLFDSTDSHNFTIYLAGDGEQSDQKAVVPITPALRQAFASGSPVYRPDKNDIARLDNPVLSRAIGSVLDVPFSGGTIAISSLYEHAFSEADINIVTQFSNVIEEGYSRLRDIRQIRERDEQLYKAQNMDSIGLLAAGVAHNFNNMLQGIMGNIYLAKLDSVSANQRERLEQAEHAGQRAAQLVRQLRLSVQPKATHNYDPIDLYDHLLNVIELARSTFNRLIELELHAEDDYPKVRMDPSYFEQVVLNVLLNARDAVTEAEAVKDDNHYPRIDIYVDVRSIDLPEATATDYLRINIVDNGTGMDEETRLRIYEPFFTTKPPGKGTGLGLSTVRNIVEGQGGHIECTSTPGEGTSFVIYVALDADAVSDETEDDSISILVVDDEEVVRNSTQSILTHHGYHVLTATDGEQAVEIFRDRRPDIVLLDLSMPRMSGRETFVAIREVNPDTKILIYTGDESELERGSFDASTPVLVKPYLASELIKKVEQVICVSQES